MHSYGWKNWAMVGVCFCLGLLYIAFKPEYLDSHREILMEQFHLPEDVAFELLHSDLPNKHSREQIVAIVQFTPGQYNNYLRSFDDAALWSLRPFEWYDVKVQASAPSRALVWWDNNDAFHDGTTYARWLEWGHEHRDQARDIQPSRSFCFAVVGEGSAQSIHQCGDLEERPDLLVRGMIDAEGQRLFALISN